jgi:hypothetical protein
MKEKPVLYSRYPITSIIIYNGITILHFFLGTAGIMLGFNYWLGYLLGSIYLVFALVEMYVLMPLKVCPNCPYYVLKDSLCISGLNKLSAKVAHAGNSKEFPKRAKGMLCPNNLYIAGFILPVILAIPGLIINFSFILLAILIILIGLLVFRVLYIFPKLACGHCRAMNICPNARSMGIGKAED